MVVIGLGRFGGSLALELEAQGTEVLGIDANEEIVQSFNGLLTHVVRADSTREEVLRQLSVHEFDRAVVGIGSDIEASILTTSRLLKFQHPQIWAKAISEPPTVCSEATTRAWAPGRCERARRRPYSTTDC